MARDLGYWIGRLRASAAFRLRRLTRRATALGAGRATTTVQSVFVAVLGRRAEPAAEAAYVQALQVGDVDVGEMVARLMASEEFGVAALARTAAGREAARQIHREMTGAEASPRDLERHVEALKDHGDLAGVLHGLGAVQVSSGEGFVPAAQEAPALVAAVTFAESLLTARLLRDGVALQLGPTRFDHLSTTVLAEKLRLLLLTLKMLSDVDRRSPLAAAR